jgi:hypothetical protein
VRMQRRKGSPGWRADGAEGGSTGTGSEEEEVEGGPSMGERAWDAALDKCVVCKQAGRDLMVRGWGEFFKCIGACRSTRVLSIMVPGVLSL